MDLYIIESAVQSTGISYNLKVKCQCLLLPKRKCGYKPGKSLLTIGNLLHCLHSLLILPIQFLVTLDWFSTMLTLC